MYWHKACAGMALVIRNWTGKLALAISLQSRIRRVTAGESHGRPKRKNNRP